MAERLMFVLDGRDQLSPVFRRAGESSEDFRRRVNQSVNASGGDLRAFTQDADGQLRALDGRFASTGDSARRMQGDMNQLQGPMRGMATATSEASAAGGGLSPILMSVAAVAGLSLLPALGAVVPMMAGAGLALGTLKLGFAGVGDAVAAASEDKKKYAAALKKLSPEARSFTKEIVGLKKEFGGLGKDIQKAMLPGFTKAVKEAGPLVKILGGGMTSLGKGFGEAAAGAGRLFGQGGFQRDLKANLDLGMQFVHGMTGGVGSLLRSLLTFGAKSGPTLKAFTTGLSGLLGAGGGGLAGMFKGLETGISGSAAFLDGFFAMINRVLPAIGRFSGEVAGTFGPLLGELADSAGIRLSGALDVLGAGVRGLSPVFKDLMFGVRATNDLFRILGPTLRDVGGALLGTFLPAFNQVDQARGPLQRLSDAINANKGTIQEVGRIMAGAFLEMSAAAIEHLPSILGIFRNVATGIVTAMGGVLHASASAFGWIPGVGDKLKSADRAFAGFRTTFISGLSAAEQKARSFAAGALPRLEQGKLKLNINNWTSQIETAKAKLKTVPPSKQAAIRATIADLQAKVAQAKAALASVQSKTVSVMVQYRSNKNPSSFAQSIGGYASGGKPRPGELAWVGEEGPELMRFGSGGAEVYSHGDSMAMVSDAASAGRDAGLGLRAGMTVSTGGVKAGGRGLGVALLAGIRDELEIASPSKKTTKQGKHAGEGLAKGLKKTKAQVAAEAKRLAALAHASGKSLITGLTGSKSQITSTVKALTAKIWAAWEGTKSKKDSALVKLLNKDNAKLQKLASKRDAIASKIAAAKKYAADITSGARQDSSLGQLGIEDGKVTAGSIKAGLGAKLAKLKTFTSYIGTLAKRGLSKSLIRQILDMGPDEGYAYASALAGSSSATLKAINKTQNAIDKATTTLGRNGADILYDSGKNAGKGFLKGLESQQDAIEKQMLKIAKAMQKAIKKALGIKSPSTVMAQLGRYSTEGLARGLTQPMPVLDAALSQVSGRVAGMQPVIGRPAVVGGGAGQTINVAVDARGAMDPVAVAQQLQKMLLKLGRAQGSTVNLKVG